MSDNTDRTLIVRASEQSKVASARLPESEAGHRLVAMEGRLGAIAWRIANLALGQTGREQAIMRIADTSADHTARLTPIETPLDAQIGQRSGVPTRLIRIEALLTDTAGRRAA
jgi:hypothetical protein